MSYIRLPAEPLLSGPRCSVVALSSVELLQRLLSLLPRPVVQPLSRGPDVCPPPTALRLY